MNQGYLTKNAMAKELRLLLGATLLLLLAATAPAVADDVVVRILFFTGDVTVKSGGSASAARIGQAVGKKDVIILKGNATLQLSVNGKVLKYNKPAQLKVADAIKRAGKGENEAVANSLRTLAAASGAGRNSRHSEAGATRAAPPTDSSRLLDDARRKGMETVKNEANSEVGKQLGIDDPLGKATGLMDYLRGDKLIVLEPRSTAISSGPVTFRWLRTPGVTSYSITVRNYLGDELFKTSVSDTQAVWPTPSLQPEAVYTWTLQNEANPLNRSTSSFFQISAQKDAELHAGEQALLKELGQTEDPATMMMLGALYADLGCYGQAARYFTMSAIKAPEHRQDLLGMAREQYLYNIVMPEEDVAIICR
ncbi:MAG: hypothetical protein JNJ94_00750 [Chlorobi bacterium]|nr:hypothetical protein [Chlorobiota bacterium]